MNIASIIAFFKLTQTLSNSMKEPGSTGITSKDENEKAELIKSKYERDLRASRQSERRDNVQKEAKRQYREKKYQSKQTMPPAELPVEYIAKDQDVLGDGFCGFRVIAFHILGNEEEHMAIKKNMLDYVVANRDYCHEHICGKNDEVLDELVKRLEYGISPESVEIAKTSFTPEKYWFNVETDQEYRSHWGYLRIKESPTITIQYDLVETDDGQDTKPNSNDGITQSTEAMERNDEEILREGIENGYPESPDIGSIARRILKKQKLLPKSQRKTYVELGLMAYDIQMYGNEYGDIVTRNIPLPSYHSITPYGEPTTES
ncbi:hypothetical protein BJV82DRAFT_579847 [Fennellomyces sp. T-0311]|nr:hypothetical protein BJV82DRAFT_579847 [Fennellomyces sp. T-0311]